MTMTLLSSTPRSTLGALFAALKAYGSTGMALHLVRDSLAPSYSDAFVGVMTFRKEHKGTQTYTEVRDIPALVFNGHTSETESYEYDGRPRIRYSGFFKPNKGCWYLGFNSTLIGVLEGLPARAEIRFEVRLDHGTNEPLIKARLHCDHLYLVAKWTSGNKEIQREFLIDTTCGEHNVARFGNSRLY